MSMSEYKDGHRPVNAWGGGDLPAPYAVGDVVDVPAGAKALERMNGRGTPMEVGAGRYTVGSVWSVDEGDAWYIRLVWHAKSGRKKIRFVSDRLHIDEDVDWLAGCTLVSTTDQAGLDLRTTMLAAGWMPPVDMDGLIRTARTAVIEAARRVLPRNERYDSRNMRDLRRALHELDRLVLLRGQ